MLSRAINNNTIPKFHLVPGAIRITTRSEMVWTALGSCVTVILTTRTNPISALCHAQLPHPRNGGMMCTHSCPHPCQGPDGSDQSGKFAGCAVRRMANRLRIKKIPNHAMMAGLVGGANSIRLTRPSKAIGSFNLEAARKALTFLGIPIFFEKAGEKKGLTFQYFTKEKLLRVRAHGQQDRWDTFSFI